MTKEIPKKYIEGISIIITIIITMGIISYVQKDCCGCGDPTNGNCCPCPNTKYVENVSDWYGHHPSGAGSWLEMCEDYKKEFNESWSCFE